MCEMCATADAAMVIARAREAADEVIERLLRIRVRTQKLRDEISDGFWQPLSAFDWCGSFDDLLPEFVERSSQI